MKLCDLETSKALQSMGYDGEYTHCHVGVYPKNEYQIMTLSDCEKYRHDVITLCAAPRLDDAAYWIRDKYDIAIWIPPSPCGETPHGYNYAVAEWEDGGWNTTWYSEELHYEDALERAVTIALDIIKNRKQ